MFTEALRDFYTSRNEPACYRSKPREWQKWNADLTELGRIGNSPSVANLRSGTQERAPLPAAEPTSALASKALIGFICSGAGILRRIAPTERRTHLKHTGSELPRLILLLWLSFVAAALLLYIIAFSHGHLRPGGRGAATGLFPGRSFEDLTVYLHTFELFHSAGFFQGDAVYVSKFAYPAGAAVIYRFFYAFPRVKVGYVLVCAPAALLPICVLFRTLIARKLTPWLAAGIALSSCLAFPAIFLVQRGNIEVVLWAVTSLGILAYVRKQRYVAAILWGIAACIKIYPILLLAIFLRGRRKSQPGPILAGIASALLSTLAALSYVGPSIGIAFRGFLSGVQGFQGSYAQTIRTQEIGFDHSLFSLLKIFAITFGYSAGKWLHPYYVIAGAAASLIYLVRVRHLPFLNRIVFATVALVLLPPVSYEYTLVHLYVPAALVLLCCIPPQTGAAPPHDHPPRSLPIAFACVLVLLLPINLFLFRGTLYAGQIQTIPLLLLGTLAALQPWPDPLAPLHASPRRLF